ncbi:MAG TPA: SMC family ATPase, partial [Gemmatimonadaceae bacterium]|nr:SMC family ATPase [Gemmatimonadaceae bacterium]
MRLNSLHLCNFRQHIDTRIDFETGITGIIGPNGSGKSTILEAIAWALYGMPAARGTRESIRSYRAAPRAAVTVELDFELGGHRYLVSRGLTSAELYLDGATSPIATSITGVTELLRRRLGMSHDEFFNTYFTGQKELSIMAAMAPAERAQFLSRVLGYERIRTAQGLVRERRKAIVSETAGLRAGMSDVDTVTRALADATSRLAEARARANTAGLRRVATHRTLDEITPRWEAMQRERDTLQTLVS